MQYRTDEIEYYAKMFPDVPLEVIVKEDILRLGLSFSGAALQMAKGCRVKSYRLFTYDKVTYDKFDRREPFVVPEDVTISGGIYKLRPTIFSVRLNPDSPYLVDVIEGKLMVCANGTPICMVQYPPMPEYHNKVFDDGTRYSDVVATVMGGAKAFITVYPVCQFWGKKLECKFCDINENTRQRKKYGFAIPRSYKPVHQVVDVMEEVFLKEKKTVGGWPFAYTISGGAILRKVDGKDEDDFYLEYVEAVKDRIGDSWPCVLQTVAKDKKTCRRYREAGVDAHDANIEVWDRELFRVLCTGKEKYVGRDEWIKRVVESVDIFGVGNVTPNFVVGLEMAQPYGFKDVTSAVKSTTEGLEYLMSHGVVVRFNQWCIEALSALAGNQPPPLEYFIRIDRAWYETWVKYDLPPVRALGSVGPGRSCWYNSAMLDMGPNLGSGTN